MTHFLKLRHHAIRHAWHTFGQQAIHHAIKHIQFILYTEVDEVGIDDDPKETDAEDHDNLKKTEYAEYDANSKESADGNSKETSDEDDDNSWETADEDDDNANSKEKVAVASNDKEGTSIRETISPCLIKMDDPVADCTLLSDNETVKPYPKFEKGRLYQ